MLLLKRLLTAAVLFVVLLVACFVLTSGTIGAIAGVRAGRAAKATDFQSGYVAGHAAGAEVGRKYGPTILLVSAGVAVLGALALSFSNVLPWCRRGNEAASGGSA